MWSNLYLNNPARRLWNTCLIKYEHIFQNVFFYPPGKTFLRKYSYIALFFFCFLFLVSMENNLANWMIRTVLQFSTGAETCVYALSCYFASGQLQIHSVIYNNYMFILFRKMKRYMHQCKWVKWRSHNFFSDRRRVSEGVIQRTKVIAIIKRM